MNEENPPPQVPANDSLLIKKKGKILILTLNRPRRANSLNPPLIELLYRTILEAQANEKIKVIVLTGTGQKNFCTGIDVDSAKDFSAKARENLANCAGDIATLLHFGTPSIVAINGRAMGMGIVFAAAADYTIIAEHARWMMPEVDAGIFPGASCIPLFYRTIGLKNTKRVLMLGEKFSAKDAVGMNLANEVTAFDEIGKRSIKVARSLSMKNPINLKAIKTAINLAPDYVYSDIQGVESRFAYYTDWERPEEEFSAIISDLIAKNNPEKPAAELTGKPIGRPATQPTAKPYKLTGDIAMLLRDFNKNKAD